MRQKTAQSLYKGFPDSSGIQASKFSRVIKRVYDGFPIEVEDGEESAFISEHPETKSLVGRVY